nr:hypothetical protein [Tanacetum cinerariifolium]
TQPPRSKTPDPEWNKDKNVNDGPEQTWFNDLVNAEKDSLTFDELMATPIDFTKFAMNHLKLDNITKADLVGIVDKKLGYGYLQEIVVRRVDQKQYTFKEGDFLKLHLNDIEDMLLLHVQNKLFNLDGDDIVDLAVPLCLFTRRIVIQKRVEDVQLGVESYQKKLKITMPQKEFPRISCKEPYTTSYDPKGVVYLNEKKRLRLMRADELYKFSDGTLKFIHEILHCRLLNFKLGYNKDMPKRKLTEKDHN